MACPWCGKPNTPGQKFCTSCGRSLHEPEPQRPLFQMGSHAVPEDMAAMYGFTVEDQIDGVKISDISQFVKSNAISFILKFKAMSMYNRIISFNFPAFFFTFLYFFYRKMYKLGTLFLAVSTVCAVPTMIVQFGYMQSQLAGVAFDYNAFSLWITLSQVAHIVLLVTSFAAMIFANYWYRSYTFKHIKQAHRDYETDTAGYHTYMNKKGGISAVAVAGVAGGLFVLSMLATVAFLLPSLLPML